MTLRAPEKRDVPAKIAHAVVLRKSLNVHVRELFQTIITDKYILHFLRLQTDKLEKEYTCYAP